MSMHAAYRTFHNSRACDIKSTCYLIPCSGLYLQVAEIQHE